MAEMGLEYESAVAQFLTMFPSLPRETIEQVIQEHQGQVEPALEKLLAMNSNDQPPKYEEIMAISIPPKTPPRSLKPKLRPERPMKPELPAFCREAERAGATNTFRSQQLEGRLSFLQFLNFE